MSTDRSRTAAEHQAREKALAYLNARGTLAAPAVIAKRIGDAFAAFESYIADVPVSLVSRRAWPDEWSVQEVVDHVLETHRPSLDELWCLLAGQRPPGDPIPASLQSKAPLTRPWTWLTREVARVHRDIVAAVEAVTTDFSTDARAPLVMVVNLEGGRPYHWTEELDWKAYAVVLRLHAIDHLNQAKKVVAGLRASEQA